MSSNSESVWFTADTHFGHKLMLVDRHFGNLDQMTQALVENWNGLIGKRDRVYHLGDLSFYGPDKTKEVLSALNGRIFLLEGNHDRTSICPKVRDRFEWIKGVHYLKMGKISVMLCHYPMLTWRNAYRGTFMLHGHCHSGMDRVNEDSRRLDVGVDCWGLCPIEWSQIEPILTARQWYRKDGTRTYYRPQEGRPLGE